MGAALRLLVTQSGHSLDYGVQKVCVAHTFRPFRPPVWALWPVGSSWLGRGHCCPAYSVVLGSMSPARCPRAVRLRLFSAPSRCAPGRGAKPADDVQRLSTVPGIARITVWAAGWNGHTRAGVLFPRFWAGSGAHRERHISIPCILHFFGVEIGNGAGTAAIDPRQSPAGTAPALGFF